MAGLISYLFHTFTKDRANQVSENLGKTRIWGTITRDLLSVFEQYTDDQDRLPISRLRTAFNQLDLYPSNSQIYEMVQCAVEYGSPCEPDHITFGEFCVLVSELKNHYLRVPSKPVPKSLYRERSESTHTPHKRWKHRVFLGGSCNPTTWRHDSVIPFLKQHGITFYNPQVQNWRPELVELEDQAKQAADVLFFVIDNETRAVASMIETAYLVALQRQVIIVVNDYKCSELKICGECLTESEVKDLLRARQILIDLVERNSVPIFKSLDTALHGTISVLHKGIHVSDLTVHDGVQPVCHGHLNVGEALLQMREAFNSMDSAGSGTLTAEDICLAYKSCMGQNLDKEWLKQRGKGENSQFIFEEFCCIMAEYQRKSKSIREKLSDFLEYFLNNLKSRHISTDYCESQETYRDIYLGGSCGDSNWRENIAIPLLRKNGLSYSNPFVNDWEQRLIPIQVSVREKCRLLLYIITDRTRSISSMIEAGYYIGKGCKVVLCVKELPENGDLGSETISKAAMKDYHRGRAYLMDLASREGVQLFDDVTEAVMCGISYLTETSL